jgi:hypothetical protein
MAVTVFKAGYAQQKTAPWSELKNPVNSEDVEWEGGKAVFKLRPMTMEERRNREVALPDVPDNRRTLFRIEKNREQMEIKPPSGKLSTK